MSQIIYFIPNVTVAPPEMLAELGLEKVLGSVSQGPITNGPGGTGGVLLTASAGPKTPLKYDADWRWCPDSPEKRYYLGYDPDNLVRSRSDIVGGKPVQLADGNQWLVPIARFYGGGTHLPVRIGKDAETGERTYSVEAAYMELWDAAGEVFSDNLRALGEYVAKQKGQQPPADAPEPMSGERRFEIAAMALGANYRMGVNEAEALELLSDRDVGEIHGVLADIDAWLGLGSEATKKKDPAEDGLNTNSGDEDSAPITDQPGPT